MNKLLVSLKSLSTVRHDALLRHKGRIENIIGFPYPSFFSRTLQTTAASVYTKINEDWRWRISSLAKKLSGMQALPEFVSIDRPTREFTDLAEVLKGRSFGGHGSALLMTHDVDYTSCYSHLMDVAEEEQKHGVRASYNFLLDTEYKITPSVLKELCDMGHEIGLHGVTYDLRLAYRTYGKMLSRLKDGKRRLEDLAGREIFGFRNHSLLYSIPLTRAVHEAGFEYQSGVYHYSAPDGFREFFCWPFRYSKSDKWEIPVSLPMDTDLFRLAQLSDEDALAYMVKRLNVIGNCNGVACINVHPTIIKEHLGFFSNLLDEIENMDALLVTPHQLVELLNQPED